MHFTVYYNDHYVVPLPESHPFPMRKYRLLRDELLARSIINASQLATPPLATRHELISVHSADYVDRVFNGQLSRDEVRRIGFPWSPELVLRARASVGGTLSAARSALDNQISGSLAGGTHHAHRDFGSGFCVFNDIAVAIEQLRAEGEITKALVIDLDVHQGDGTAEIFKSDADVYTFSIHNEKNFPVRKTKSTQDIALSDNTGDEEYLSELIPGLQKAIERSMPEIIFYQAGVDVLASDKWGRLNLTPEGTLERDRSVVKFARERAIPIVLTLGGGYSVPIEHTIDAHCNTYRMAVEHFCA